MEMVANGVGHDPMNVQRTARRAGKTPPAGTMQAAPAYQDMHSTSTSDNVLHVNFGLSWQKIAAMLGGLGTLLGAAVTAGWLVMPASKSELDGVNLKLQQTIVEVQELKGAMRDLTEAMGRLGAVVERTAATTAATREAVTTRLPRARPAPAPR